MLTQHDNTEAPRPDKILVVLLDRELRLAVIDSVPIGFSTDEQRLFRRLTGELFHGFYDWLRAGEDAIIGLRYWPSDDTAFFVDELTDRNYIDIDESKACISIFWNKNRKFIREASDDQDFGNNTLYINDLGVYALTFSMSAGILAAVQRACGDICSWVTLSPCID